MASPSSDKNNPAVHQHVRRASALPLVPTDQVDNVWFHALNDFQTDDINITRFNNFQTDDINITRFNDYVTEQWVESDTERWNHYTTVGPRTTNHLERWHHKLNNQLHKAHPNLFLVIQKLQNIQAANEIRLIQYAAGGKRKTQKLKYRSIDSRLDQLKERLQQGEI